MRKYIYSEREERNTKSARKISPILIIHNNVITYIQNLSKFYDAAYVLNSRYTK